MPSPAGHILSGLIVAAIPARSSKELNIKRLLLGAFFETFEKLDRFPIL